MNSESTEVRPRKLLQKDLPFQSNLRPAREAVHLRARPAHSIQATPVAGAQLTVGLDHVCKTPPQNTRVCVCTGSNCVPQRPASPSAEKKMYSGSEPLVPMEVALFGNRVSAGGVKVRSRPLDLSGP